MVLPTGKKALEPGSLPDSSTSKALVNEISNTKRYWYIFFFYYLLPFACVYVL